jgi:hypothetical protein
MSEDACILSSGADVYESAVLMCKPFHNLPLEATKLTFVLSRQGKYSGPHYLYRPRGKSLPELRKTCGLTGLLVIIEERERWEQRLAELYASNDYVEYKFVSVGPPSP